jgi:hypothetical protein
VSFWAKSSEFRPESKTHISKINFQLLSGWVNISIYNQITLCAKFIKNFHNFKKSRFKLSEKLTNKKAHKYFHSEILIKFTENIIFNVTNRVSHINKA